MQIQFPDYTVLSKIGCGSQHQVYLAKEKSSSKSFAIKIEKNPQLGQLENEIKVLQKLKGIEGIPKIKQIGVAQENKCYFVLPLLHSNLLELVKGRKVSQSAIMRIGLRVIEILEQVHKKNILHLDIKPENIMISQAFEKESDIEKDGFIQLIDFGLSQLYEENSEGLQDVFIGSLNFASRSSHDGSPLGYKDDLESLLYVLFYLKDLTLPWSHQQYYTFSVQDFELIKQSKLTFFKTLILQCKSFNHFSVFMSYINQLHYNQIPDYSYIREVFKHMIQASNNSIIQFKLDQQQSLCTPTQSYLEDSEIQKITNCDNFEEILLEHNNNGSEKTIILVSNLVGKYNTKQIKSIKDIKY
ncbi:unnamed protein product (macronuclear) [Paramecium tetraurelia]|uniref:Casein kinase I n=1 Tax=Paramecium tetraurelia TaxID=5888 RepID=A0CGD1_PARTE|nr:uncharacterized protein GSPATT00007288001 [Paramecium tetraurelia]CAK69848.1 unnamed protein product [Paramecium tetraurelia]|eukprot:XP_001437245.1 hypothetical protein (macronuclear) [Paramecium tetraurelia strain d4-2]